MTNVLKMVRSGTPASLLQNALDEANQYEFSIIVSLTKDDVVRCDWSKVKSGIAALGAVEILRERIMDELR